MIRIASSDFHAAAIAARESDKVIIRDLRRGLRLAGADTAAAVRAEIGLIPSSGRYNTGVRSALAQGTRVSISVASAKSAGVRIVTRGPLAKAMNRSRFRHPVFADAAKARADWAWADQRGRPYFGKVIASRHGRMESEIWRALETAKFAIADKQRKAANDVQ